MQPEVKGELHDRATADPNQPHLIERHLSVVPEPDPDLSPVRFDRYNPSQSD